LQYSVTLHTESSIELSEAVARLTGTGITSSDLSYVSGDGSSLNWTFNLTIPFSKMSEMNATLAQLRTKLGRLQLAPALDVAVYGLQASTAATAQACPLAALVSDARKEADRIATAAGIHVGAIVSLSEATVPTAVQRSGDFSFAVLSVSRLPVVFDPIYSGFEVPQPTTPCSLIVQFRIAP
jgi:hypothetical protein